MIPHRWMSVTITSAIALVVGRVGEGLSLGLGLRGCVAGVHARVCGRGLRWARSTDADGEGDVRGLPGHGICTGPLDFATLIDGFVSSAGLDLVVTGTGALQSTEVLQITIGFVRAISVSQECASSDLEQKPSTVERKQ
jgi:hypothetical protein